MTRKASDHDPEAQVPTRESASQAGVNTCLVTWNGPSDPEDPKNWSFPTRWRITAIASAFAFISRVSTSMMAPAMSTIGTDLGINEPFERSLCLSIFLLAYSFGPFLAAPLCEIYGRQLIQQLFALLFVVFNLACGFAETGPQLIVCRLFAGFGGSAATVISAGILGDVWRREERGLSVSIYTLVTLLGPTLGPLLGGFITQYSSWRWIFWAISIADVCIQLVAAFFSRETYAPVLLESKAKRLREETGNQELRTKWENPGRTFTSKLQAGLSRPFIMLTTQPIFQVLAVYNCYLFGLTYLVLATFAELWTTSYHESISIAGLNYLALAVGYIIGTQSCSRLVDIIYRRLQEKRQGDISRPEFRLPLLGLGALLVPVGMIWYGWSAEKHLPWIMPDIGIAIFGIGARFGTQCIQLYVLDIYPTYAASASAGSMFLSSLSGFAFPIFAPYLYQALNYGWGNTLLAVIASLIGIPAPILLWFYGPILRKRSPYATET